MRRIMLFGAGLILGSCILPIQAQEPTSLYAPKLTEPEHSTRNYLVEPVKPKYPESAQQAGIQGEVIIFVRFDKDGKLVETKPLKSPDDSLTTAVLDALKGCRVKPHAPLYPEATYRSEIRFIFSLKNGEPEVSEFSKDEQIKPSKEFKEEMNRRITNRDNPPT